MKKVIRFVVIPIIAVILLVSLLLATPFGKRYTSDLLGSLLEETIGKATGPEVAFTFESLEFDLLKGHLRIDQIETIVQETESANKVLDTAVVETLELKVRSLWAVYFTRNLQIEGMRVTRPRVGINLGGSEPKQEKKRVTMHTADIYSYISNVLNELKINDFQLQNGHFTFQYIDNGSPQKQVINDISITIENFDLSDETRKDDEGIFFTENIELVMTNQESLLPDSVHIARFDSLVLSTKRKLFQIYGFRISPHLLTNSQENTIKLSFRLMDFERFDFEKVYQEQIIHIGSIMVDGASIVLDNNKPRQSQKVDREGILSQINQLFGQVSIDTVGVNNSSMEISTYPGGMMQKERIEEIDFRIYGLNLDDSNKEFSLEHRYFDGVEIIIDNYKAELAAANQLISFEKIIVSSSTKLLRASGIRLSPIDSLNARYGLTKGSIDEVVLTEFDAFAIATSKQATIRDFVIHNLQLVHIPAAGTSDSDTTPEGSESEPDINLDNLYPLISGSLDLLQIKNIDFRNLNIDIKDPKTLNDIVNIQRAGVRFSDFLLDSTSYLTDDHLFHAQDVVLEFPLVEIQTKSQRFRIQDLLLQRENNLISASEISIDTLVRTENTQFEAAIDNFYFSGANLREILYHNRYNFDTLYFFNPRIKLYSREVDKDVNTTRDTRVKDILEVFDLDLLGFQNANLEFYRNDSLAGILHEFTFGLVNTKFDPDSLENDRILARYDNFYIEFDSLDWFLPAISHELRIRDFSLNLKDSTGSFKNLTLRPTEGNTGSVYNISIPNAYAKGIFGHQRTFNRNLDIRLMHFEDPIFQIELKSSETPKEPSVSKPFPVNSDPFRLLWDTVKIPSIQFTNVRSTVHLQDSTLLDIKELDLEIENYTPMRGQKMEAERFLFSDDIAIDARGVNFNNRKASAGVNRLRISTGTGQLELDTLNLKQSGNSPLSMDLKGVRINGLNPYGYLVERKLNLNSIEINSPLLHLKPGSAARDTVSKPLPDRFAQLNKYPFATTLVSSVGLDSLKVNDIQLTLLDHQNRDSLGLGSFDFALSGLYLDSSSVVNNDIPFHSDMYSLTARNTSYPLSPFMRAGLDSLYYSSADSLLQINGIRLIPTYPKYEYGVAFGKQTDWVDLSAGSLQIENLDLPSIITEKRVQASKLILENTNLSLFRDKNIPFPEDQVRYLPQKNLDDIPYDLLIDTLALTNFNVVYEELPEDGEIAGRFSVDKINAKVFPVTNMPESVPEDSMMNVEAAGLLMNSGNLSTTMKFNLLDPTYSWTLDASLGPMDLTRLNQMLINTANARIRRGSTSSLRQRFYADDSYAEGVMEFYYKNLSVELLNPDHIYEKKGVGKAITTFFANAFVVKSRNPRPFLKRGEIFFIRDHSRSIFNYMSKATLSGVVTSVGARSNQRAIRELNREEKKIAQEERKKKKQEKKAERRSSR